MNKDKYFILFPKPREQIFGIYKYKTVLGKIDESTRKFLS